MWCVQTEPYVFMDELPESFLSLHGSVVRHIMSNHPFKGTKVQESGNIKVYSGFIPDLVYELSKRVGFSYKFVEAPDGKYGAPNANTQTWDGLIGEVLKNEVNTYI